MKAQLTELLTNYGDIMSIWFDGHWDQTNPKVPLTGHPESIGNTMKYIH